jgi:hypothetical protein
MRLGLADRYFIVNIPTLTLLAAASCGFWTIALSGDLIGAGEIHLSLERAFDERLGSEIKLRK